MKSIKLMTTGYPWLLDNDIKFNIIQAIYTFTIHLDFSTEKNV